MGEESGAEEEEDESESEWSEGSGGSEVVGMRDEPGSTSSVVCVTKDYAMQNVILQMGLRLAAPDGLQIRETRRWALRCAACFQVSKVVTRTHPLLPGMCLQGWSCCFMSLLWSLWQPRGDVLQHKQRGLLNRVLSCACVHFRRQTGFSVASVAMQHCRKWRWWSGQMACCNMASARSTGYGARAFPCQSLR
jgi:hypothetical protein